MTFRSVLDPLAACWDPNPRPRRDCCLKPVPNRSARLPTSPLKQPCLNLVQIIWFNEPDLRKLFDLVANKHFWSSIEGVGTISTSHIRFYYAFSLYVVQLTITTEYSLATDYSQRKQNAQLFRFCCLWLSGHAIYIAAFRVM